VVVRFIRILICAVTVYLMSGTLALAQVEQAPPPPASTATVPRLIRIRGAVRDETGKPLSGGIGITFALYTGETDSSAIWQEDQTVQLDSAGSYSVLLGAANEGGLPQEVFSTGEARWLGVRPEGQPEQPRILLLSVAYALKAADTDMLGGKPASAFVLADNQSSSAQAATAAQVGSATSYPVLQMPSKGSTLSPLVLTPATTCASITSDGTATANQISKFTTACNIENSAIFESGGNVGIGNTGPAAKLDVSGTSIIRGSLTAQAGAVFPPTAAATATQGFDSNPLELEAASYNTTLLRSVDYIFQWQAEPTGNDSTNTGATLNLLYGVTGDVSETGLSIAKNGILTFAPGQTFPVAGTVTSISTGAGLTGGPITKTGTISIPAAGVTNTMLADSTIKVVAGTGLSGGGTVALGGTVTLTNAAPSSGGTVTSISTGAGLTGGPITKTGTISIPAAGVTNSMLADSSIKVVAGTGLSGGGTVALGGTVTLTNASPSSGGTVTSITTGAGLTGGPITKTGTISIPTGGITNTLLADSSINVLAGSGLSGGGTVALGGTVTLSSNVSGTTDGMAYFSSPTSLTSTAAPANGQILIGKTGDAPVLGTLTAGQNIEIANNPGSITISAASSVPTFQFFVTGGARTGAAQAATQNVTTVWGFLLPYSVTTTQITYSVTTVDKTSNDYDIGIFSTLGKLLVDIGPTPGTTFSALGGFHTLSWSQGSIGLAPGEYYLAFTTNCATSCAQIGAAASNVSFAINISEGTSTGGALPSTITPPAEVWATGNQPTVVIH
jgi:trimeric autotransporter adhesin